MQLIVNGTTHQLDVAGSETLLTVLRDRLNLTGTKLSCERGECGACTVLLAPRNQPRRAVYSCLTLAAACDDASVMTIEGLAEGDVMHPLQEAFITRDAVQCGFCTPGQILAAVALLEQNPRPTESDIRVAMSGNLCRCGTYPKIVLAVRDAAERMSHDRP
ncbi:MAG TPA: (2Fe-2S)-binding protein [Gemmatimonadaceae bacterium]|nr:(2Fe-2S)-binding protein [Gemmatimonadaceae bacterium]